jgi:hypothetical protein
MQVPAHLRRYHCEDYFDSEWAEQGYWDEPSQLMLIVPAVDVKERPELSLLVIGRPGVDGIEFGYRLGQQGLWAYYPIDREFVVVSVSVKQLVESFLSGELSV